MRSHSSSTATFLGSRPATVKASYSFVARNVEPICPSRTSLFQAGSFSAAFSTYTGTGGEHPLARRFEANDTKPARPSEGDREPVARGPSGGRDFFPAGVGGSPDLARAPCSGPASSILPGLRLGLPAGGFATCTVRLPPHPNPVRRLLLPDIPAGVAWDVVVLALDSLCLLLDAWSSALRFPTLCASTRAAELYATTISRALHPWRALASEQRAESRHKCQLTETLASGPGGCSCSELRLQETKRHHVHQCCTSSV